MKELLVQGIKMMEKAKLFKVAAGIFTEIFDAFQIPRVLLFTSKMPQGNGTYGVYLTLFLCINKTDKTEKMVYSPNCAMILVTGGGEGG